jgi:hypothetical protein
MNGWTNGYLNEDTITGYTLVIKGRQKLVYMWTGHSGLIRKRTVVLLQNMYMYLIQQEIRVFFIKKNC